MVEVRLELKFMADLNDPGEFSAVQSAFETLKSLGAPTAPIKNAPATEKAKAPEQKKAVAPATKKTEPEPEAQPEDDGITVDNVREALAKKVEAHRAQIKTKLTELGAPNVTALPKEKYKEFVAFLEKLS